jgi:hypothetical protein
VSLFGPVPGIALGVVCTMLFHATGREIFMHGARAFLIVNTFNLLPFVPLDGGHYLEAVLFSRSPILRTLFTVLAGAVLAVIAVAARDVFFGIIALFVLLSVQSTYLSSRLAADLKRELAAQHVAEPGSRELATADRIPTRHLERLISRLEPRLPEQQRNAPTMARVVRNIWNMVWFKPPSIIASAALVLLYVACLGTGVVASVGAEASFRIGRADLPLTTWIEGGLYAMKAGGGEGYRVLKILKIDEKGVHIRLYGKRLAAIPTRIDESSLYVNGPEGGQEGRAGVGHLAVSKSSFSEWDVRFIQQSSVSAQELEGYRVWLADKGGYL